MPNTCFHLLDKILINLGVLKFCMNAKILVMGVCDGLGIGSGLQKMSIIGLVLIGRGGAAV